jgi:hypothetical protein
MSRIGRPRPLDESMRRPVRLAADALTIPQRCAIEPLPREASAVTYDVCLGI